MTQVPMTQISYDLRSRLRLHLPFWPQFAQPLWFQFALLF
ncbi:MAG: hypothetical protein QOE16_2180 [Microbacteriaceae bacterium]|nr:hypothetical protein [Microbacteriaceae bacterium]